jgi:hypothetical protein
LWNRLGATLANGGHPEDAISSCKSSLLHLVGRSFEQDRTALSIRPNFTRSLYNLGVSCLNINCFQEAAEHLLAAIELQGTAGKGEASDGLWQTLRRTFVCMVRFSPQLHIHSLTCLLRNDTISQRRRELTPTSTRLEPSLTFDRYRLFALAIVKLPQRCPYKLGATFLEARLRERMNALLLPSNLPILHPCCFQCLSA